MCKTYIDNYDCFPECSNKSHIDTSSSSSHGILFLSVAVSTTDRQVSRLVAFFHADERPIFSGFKPASIARSQVWLGLPFGRFQSEGGFWIADDTDTGQMHYGNLM